VHTLFGQTQCISKDLERDQKSGIRFSVRSRDRLKHLGRTTRRRCFPPKAIPLQMIRALRESRRESLAGNSLQIGMDRVDQLPFAFMANSRANKRFLLGRNEIRLCHRPPF
jgi:hypothetical protein